MNPLVIASLAISVIALVVSFIALNAAKSSTPPAVGATKAKPKPGAQVSAQLVKMPSDTGHGAVVQDYRFWITNIGSGTAFNVTFDVELDETVLFQQEMEEKLWQSMEPGDKIELCTRIGLNTPKVFRVIAYWDTPDGQNVAQDYWVSKDTE